MQACRLSIVFVLYWTWLTSQLIRSAVVGEVVIVSSVSGFVEDLNG